VNGAAFAKGNGAPEEEVIAIGARRARIGIVCICCAILFGEGYDSIAMSFVAPTLASALSLTPGIITLLIAAAPVGAVLSALFVAPLADRLGRKRLLLFGVVLATVASLLNGTASTVVELIGWRFATGAAIGITTPVTGALAGDYAPKRLRGRLVTLIYCGLSVGSIFAGLIAVPLIETRGWQSIFLVGGLLSGLVLPFVWRVLPESLGYLIHNGRAQEARSLAARLGVPLPDIVSPGDKTRRRPAQLLRGPLGSVTVLLWLLVLATAIAYSLISYWLPTLVKSAGHDLATATLAGAVMHLGGLVGCLLFGWLMDAIGPYRTQYLTFGAGVLGLIALGSAQQPAWLLGASLLTGVCVEGSMVGMNAFGASIYPLDVRATGLGWMTGVGRLGGVVGPLFAGLLLSLHWRPAQIFYTVIVPTTVALLTVVALERRATHRN
jgi:AAHS family 4-hydroxybenzoate transporter-like MFS transporter